jgi:photosystem II stability/assembly factor-like uncharacterized protein
VALALALGLSACDGTCSRPEPGAAPAASAPAQPASRRALYASRDGGRTWRAVEGALPDDAQVAFMEPWGTRLVVATDGHYLFAGDPTAASSWVRLGGELPRAKITALHVDGDDLYVGVHESGLFVGRDGGTRWQSLQGDLAEPKVRAIATMDGRLLAGADDGIWRRRAGDSGWDRVFAECQVVSLHRSGDSVVAGGACGALLSRDRGETWLFIQREGALHSVAVLPTSAGQQQVRIVLMNISGDVHVSDDWGTSWREIEYQPRAQSYVYEVVASAGRLIASNNYGIHASMGDGREWEHIHFTEDLIFSDLTTMDGVLYGGTRIWREYRPKSR